MAADKGFLARLTGSDVDEAGLAAQARLAIDPMERLGMSARNLVGGLGTAAAGLVRGGEGRSLKGALGNVARGAQAEQDATTAQLVGITPEELQSRRAVRQELGKTNFVDDGTHSARIRMAARAAEIANSMGDTAGLSRALQALDETREEQFEFNKLEAKEARDAEKHQLGNIKNAYDTTGNAYSGILHIDKDGRSGMKIADSATGNLVFRPFGEDFSMVDPFKKKSSRNLAATMRDLITPTDRKRIHNMAAGANAALGRTDRVLSSLWDAANSGMGADALIGPAGKLATTVDNFMRAARSTVRTFSSRGAARDVKNKRRWDEIATNGQGVLEWEDEFGRLVNVDVEDIFSLPPGIEKVSAAAQQYRAAIMDMAYMAARLAEPSNRGLSDKDIEAALVRIAGGTSNPQVMVRRFLEMQLDAANELEFAISLYHGAAGPEFSNEDITLNLAGEGYKDYKSRKDALFAKYGVTGVISNRVVLGQPKLDDADMNPALVPDGADSSGRTVNDRMRALPSNLQLDVMLNRKTIDEAEAEALGE